MNKYRIFTGFLCLCLVAVILTVSFSGCAQIKLNKFMEGLSEEDMDCPAYDLEKYTKYYWDSPIIYNESVMPLEEKDGTIKPIPLMYKAKEILAVRNSHLDVLYEEGKDYVLEKGMLVIPEGSSIKTIDYTTYYPSEGERITEKKDGGYILGGGLHELQIAVTYAHADKWKGTVPLAQGSTLVKTVEKLKNKEPIKILIYGDSICEGAEATSTVGEGGTAPYMPTWFSMLEKKLKEVYGYEEIEIVNEAVGGTDSLWGYQNAKAKAQVHKPDLAIIGYGMNDIAREPRELCDNLSYTMGMIKGGNPDCEFILISTMLPNPESAHFYGTQPGFNEAMQNYNFAVVGTTVIADMTTLYSDFLINKRYWDINSNNINHPNDFLIRAYTQLMLRTLEVEE